MINELLITLGIPVMSVCCGCCHTTKPSPSAFQVFINSISLYQWLVIVFAIIGIVLLCCSIWVKEGKRIFQKGSVICFLLMVGFCANTELCWIVISVLLVAMLLKFDAITKWLEVFGKDENEQTKNPKK